MSRFQYIFIADKIGNKGGRGKMAKAHSVTTHHTGVEAKLTDDPIKKAIAITRYKQGYTPYHFLIPYNNSDNIYIIQFLDKYTYHNSNLKANQDSVAITFDGNYDKQKPLSKQLQKYRQLLNDIETDWFSKNGYHGFEHNIYPRDNKTKKTYYNRTVNILHYHNEVALAGHSTSCCGVNLIPYVKDFRVKAGKVSWGEIPSPIPPTTDWIKECEPVGPFLKQMKFEPTALYDIDKNKAIKTYPKGTKLTIHYQYKDYFLTKWSYDNKKKNGFKITDLEDIKIIKKKEEKNEEVKVTDTVEVTKIEIQKDNNLLLEALAKFAEIVKNIFSKK